MSSSVVVNKYAKSLFEVAYQSGNAGEIGVQLAEVSKAVTGEMLLFFNNPFNAQEDKVSVIKNTLEGKCVAEAYNFLITLAKNDRMGLLEDISKAYTVLVQNSAGVSKGKLYSSLDVSPEFIKQAEEKASKALGKKVELVFEKSETMIAGYKIEVAGWTMDDSAQTHLKNLKENLIKRG